MSVLPTLVVNPDGVAARNLCEHLDRAGFASDVASSCWTASTMARMRTYGCLACFVDLSLASDRECLTALRAQLPRTWIIAINSTTAPDAPQLARRSGADTVLGHPFSMEDLATRLAAFSLRSRPPDAGG